MRRSTKPSFGIVYVSPGLTRCEVQNDVETLGHAPESESEKVGPLSVLDLRQDPKPALLQPIPELVDSAKLRAMMRQLFNKEPYRIRTIKVK